MELKVPYEDFAKAVEDIFKLQMEGLDKDAQIIALKFELDLSRRIQESLARLNMQVLSGC